MKSYVKKYNIMTRIPAKETKIRWAQVACLYWKFHKTEKEIAEITGYTLGTVKGYITKYRELEKFYDDYFNTDAPSKVEYVRTPLPTFKDKYEHLCPEEECGLYLVGSTYFDPLTMELYYWIKVGMSTNLKKRIKNYHTENPMIFVADLMECDSFNVYDMEHDCHIALSDVAYGIAQDTVEWFIVDRETYLEICKKGFRYFFS